MTKSGNGSWYEGKVLAEVGSLKKLSGFGPGEAATAKVYLAEYNATCAYRDGSVEPCIITIHHVLEKFGANAGKVRQVISDGSWDGSRILP